MNSIFGDRKQLISNLLALLGKKHLEFLALHAHARQLGQAIVEDGGDLLQMSVAQHEVAHWQADFFGQCDEFLRLDLFLSGHGV